MPSEPVLFVHPEYINNRFVGYTHHYGCSSIIGTLKRHGIAAETFLGPRSWPLRRVAEELAARRPRFVGFSCYDVNFYLIRLLVAELRRLDQRAVVVLGGPTPTFSWDLLLDHVEGIDGCVAGDGEDVVLELLEKGIRRDHLPQVDGFFSRDSERTGRPHNLKHDINEYPSPYATGEIPGTAAPNVGLFSSRGCYYRCTFCNFAALSNFRVRSYTTDRLLEEISRIAHGLAGQFALVPFYDDFFTIYKQRTRAVCQGIIDNGFQRRLAFSCQTRVDSVDRELLEGLREAGFRIISFGIESASLKVLKTIHKVRLGKRADEPGFTPEAEFLDSLRRGVSLARELGFRVTGSIILGLPGETLDDGRETLGFVRELGLDAYSHNFLNVFPGTELFRTHGDFGIGVEPSTTLLPYRTTPAYDVVEVGYLPEYADIGHHERIAELIRRVMEAKSRGRLGEDYGDTFYLELRHPGPVTASYWDRLQDAAHPDSYLILVQRAADPAWYSENFRQMVARDLPILEQKVVVADDDGVGFYISNRGEWGAPTRTFCDRAARLPFSALFDSGARKPSNVFYHLDGEEDRRALAAHATQFARDGVYALPETALRGRACVEGLCRFGLGCPLRSGSGTFQDDQGEQHSICGLSLGAGDSGDSLARLAARSDEARGCDTCPARQDCSRCLNLGHVPDQEYCRLLRSASSLPAYARLLDFIFSRAGAGRAPAAEEGRNVLFKGFAVDGRNACLTYRGELGEWPAAGDGGELRSLRRVRPEVFLMLYRGNPIFYEPGRDELIEVSLPLAELAEALHAGASDAAMARYFAGKYGLDEGEATAKIGQAAAILDQHGLTAAAANEGSSR